MDGKKYLPSFGKFISDFIIFFNCPEFYPGWSWWHPRSLTCWRNVHSAYTCKITVREVTLALIQKICLHVEIGHTGNTNTRCCLTWPIRGCNRPGLWSWCRFPPFQHRLFLMSGRTCMVWKHRATRHYDSKVYERVLHGKLTINWQPAYLIKSGFPSSLPLCSSPLVQAKMLAMGLVLVGLPCKGRDQIRYCKF